MLLEVSDALSPFCSFGGDSGLHNQKWMREIRVNQSGSVALSAEEVRGPPQRKLLMTNMLLTRLAYYEPGGCGFESCRARQQVKGLGLFGLTHFSYGVA